MSDAAASAGPHPAGNSSELRLALWDAANTLRGSAVDRTDWKGYILPLLFFKRISVYMKNVDPEDEQDWPRQHEWLAAKVNDFHKVFLNRVRDLDTDEWQKEREAGGASGQEATQV